MQNEKTKNNSIKKWVISLPILFLIIYSVEDSYLRRINKKAQIIINITKSALLDSHNSRFKSNILSNQTPANTPKYLVIKTKTISKQNIFDTSNIKANPIVSSVKVVSNSVNTNIALNSETNASEVSFVDNGDLLNINKDVKIEDMITVSDSDAGLRLDRALKMLKAGDTVTALAEIRDIAKTNRKFVAVWHNLIVIYLGQSDKVNAIKGLNKLLKLANSERIKKKLNEVLKLTKEDRLDEALKKLKGLRPNEY